MQNLLDSPSNKLEQETAEKLDNLSPSKYGKAAYVNLTYTPSKLKENVLYRETTTMKRVEESNSKVRELESQNIMLEDKVSKLREERDGIEESLNTQIQMYKKLLADSEAKYQVRIKNMQLTFSEKMDQFLREKEEEAKYAQSEKEALEDQIERLKKIIGDLEYKISHSGDCNQELTNQNEKLQLENQHLKDDLEATKKQKEQQNKKSKEDYEKLSREKFQSEVALKQQMDEKLLEKEREIDVIKRIHQEELTKIQQQRTNDNILKNEETKQITRAFETETSRLNKIIEEKQDSLNLLHEELSAEKAKLLSLTRNYECEINSLAHEKGRYLTELEATQKENSDLIRSLGDHRAIFESDKASLEGYIADLKLEADHARQNLLQEKERSRGLNLDLERELSLLKEQRTMVTRASSDNIFLHREVDNLKELLLQSSSELENCKEEFIKMGRQRDILLVKLRELGHENDALYRIKQQRELEGRQWRDAYYRSKANH